MKDSKAALLSELSLRSTTRTGWRKAASLAITEGLLTKEQAYQVDEMLTARIEQVRAQLGRRNSHNPFADGK